MYSDLNASPVMSKLIGISIRSDQTESVYSTMEHPATGLLFTNESNAVYVGAWNPNTENWTPSNKQTF